MQKALIYRAGAVSTEQMLGIADALAASVNDCRKDGREVMTVSVYQIEAVLDLLRQVMNARDYYWRLINERASNGKMEASPPAASQAGQ